ncbi:hypothetical protein SKAU_G00385060 [Synaphobranchus kaupii]|uniref:Uncharacterized protein n=1 Tax=Synaphobranchus kaupii TaxID=118154 RepID=A0A9Q1EEJ6_SYNKA|nr:hypothetical protein SKAU_G00385060 [Synaphobranchus kaupii]
MKRLECNVPGVLSRVSYRLASGSGQARGRRQARTNGTLVHLSACHRRGNERTPAPVEVTRVRTATGRRSARERDSCDQTESKRRAKCNYIIRKDLQGISAMQSRFKLATAPLQGTEPTAWWDFPGEWKQSLWQLLSSQRPTTDRHHILDGARQIGVHLGASPSSFSLEQLHYQECSLTAD